MTATQAPLALIQFTTASARPTAGNDVGCHVPRSDAHFPDAPVVGEDREDSDFAVLDVSHKQSADATWSLRWGDGRDFRGVRDAGESEAYKRGRLCFQSLVFGIIHAVFALNGVDK